MAKLVCDERLREQDLERIQKLRIFDDDFLKEVFDGNFESTELVLNIIFDRNDIKVTKVIGQREIKGIEGHSVRLDIMAEDSEGRAYDIEVQRQDKGWLPLRARYNSSMMDTVLLSEGEDYSKLIPTYVIFFVERDAVGDGLPLHHYTMRDEKTNEPLGDERHIIFVNGDNKDESTRLGKLVHDFKCTSPNEMYYDVLAKRVRHFKETEGGIAHMCKLLEDMRNEAARDAEIQSAIDTARFYGVPDETILSDLMKRFGLTDEQAKEYMLRKSA
ncbi:MAG: Rpn family recombination-promoting nuclease/putative transposase [Lachnospiraceae bacterium]|nr:Rpn family recombination-promoting nuclease/putative transposase [Lachnospiraceae bacterium]